MSKLMKNQPLDDVKTESLDIPPPPSPDRGSPLYVGEPGFFEIALEKLYLEVLYGVNWVTVLPAIIVGYQTFLSNTTNHDVGVVIMAVLLGLNAAIRAFSDAGGNGMLDAAYSRAVSKRVDEEEKKEHERV